MPLAVGADEVAEASIARWRREFFREVSSGNEEDEIGQLTRECLLTPKLKTERIVVNKVYQ